MGYLYLDKPLSFSSAGHFLRRRFARVYPLFAFIVLLSFALTHIFEHWHYWIYHIKTWGYLVQNLGAHTGESVLWSVVTELRFYFFFPVIWLIYKRSASAAIFALLCLTLIFYLYSRHYLREDTPPPPEIMVNLSMGWTMYAGSYFFAGIMTAIILSRAKALPLLFWNIAFAISLGLFLMLYPSITPFVDRPSTDVPVRILYDMWANPIYLLFTTALLISTIKAPISEVLFANRPMLFFGKISYSFYLWHMPVLWYLNRFTGLGDDPYLFFVIALALIILVSYISFLGIEKPMRTLINRQRKSQVSPA